MGLGAALRAAPSAARVWVFIALVAAVSAVVWGVGLGGGAEPERTVLPWWGLAVFFYFAEVFVVHLHFRKQAHTLSPSEIALVLGLFLTSPAGLLAAQVVGAGLAFALHRRQRPVKIAFNLALQSLCTGTAFLVFHLAGGTGPLSIQSWGAALLAAGIAHGMGVLLVSAVIGVAEGRFSAPQLPQTFVVTVIGALAVACVALTAVELYALEPLALPLFVVPAAICGLTFYRYGVHREQREHIQFLYESMRATQGAPEFGLAVGQLLESARRLLRAEHAEILLLPAAPGSSVLRSTSSPAGEQLMQPVDLTAAVQLAFEHVTESERAIMLPRRRAVHPVDGLLGSLGLADGVVAALRGEERVFGLLVVGGRVGDVSTFNRNDLALFETFAGHASVLLQNGRLEQSLAQLTEMKEKLRHQAYHDALTQLPNRVLFTDRVAEALARSTVDGSQHAVLFLDLDGFKVVNDTWGHATGDELLVRVAERLARTIRPLDTAARLGGDEFAVLLEDTGADDAGQTARRIAKALGVPYYVAGREVGIRVSVGIAVSGEQATTAEEILRNADIAMYTAKGEDRRRYAFYEPALHKRLRLRRKLVLDLERAVERDEIEVHYQPVVALADSRLHALEVLARWRHPTRGVLDASEFIGPAEEAGLIRELGRNVRERAFRDGRAWPDLGLWINLSPRELLEEQLVEDIADSLGRAGVDADRVTFEITESSVIRDEAGALRAMRRLRELGVHLSIDDFGTGYSSLSRLAEFPIEMLKVPKPFVDRLAGVEPDSSFVDAILRLAASLGLDCVGEGVEHAAQARRLDELGCRYGQGWLFSAPLRAEQVAALVWGSAAVPVAPPSVL